MKLSLVAIVKSSQILCATISLSNGSLWINSKEETVKACSKEIGNISKPLSSTNCRKSSKPF